MVNPVVATDGFSYEREAILTHIRRCALSPITGERLHPTRLLRGDRVAQLVRNFLTANPWASSFLYQQEEELFRFLDATRVGHKGDMLRIAKRDARVVVRRSPSLPAFGPRLHPDVPALWCTACGFAPPSIVEWAASVVPAALATEGLSGFPLREMTKTLEVEGYPMRALYTTARLAVESADQHRFSLMLRAGVNPHHVCVVGEPSAEVGIPLAMVLAAVGKVWMVDDLVEHGFDPHDPALRTGPCRRGRVVVRDGSLVVDAAVPEVELTLRGAAADRARSFPGAYGAGPRVNPRALRGGDCEPADAPAAVAAVVRPE